MSRIATKSWCNALAGVSVFDPNNDMTQCPTKKQIDNIQKLMVKTTGTTWDSWASLVSGYTDNRLVRRDDIGHKVNCTYYKGVSGECNIYFCQNGFTETNGVVPESAKTLSIKPFTGSSDNTNHSTLLGFSNDFFSKIGGSEWHNARIVADMSSSTEDVMQYIINDIPGSKSSNGSYFSWTNAETLQIFSTLKQNKLSIYVSDKSTSYTLTSSVPARDLEMSNGVSKLITFTYNTYETNANGETVLVESETVSPTWTTSDSSLATASGNSIIANSNDKQGLVTITATYAGISLSWNIQVYKYKFSLSLDKSSLSIFVGNTASLKAFYNKHKVILTGTDGDIIDTANITSSCNWESSVPTVATVSKGVVSGKSSGTTTITAKYPASNPTHSATATVIVKSRGKVSFHTTNYSTNFINRGFSKSQYERNPYIGTFETWAASMCNATGYSYSYQNSGSVDILFEITKSSEWQSGYYYMLQVTNTATYLSEVYISSADVIKLNNGTNVTLTPRELTLAHATDPDNYLVLTITNFKTLSDIAYSNEHMDVADGMDKNWILTTNGYPITEYVTFDYTSNLYNYINDCTNTISATKESWQNLKSWISEGGRVYLAPIDPDSGETVGYDGWSKEANTAVLTAIETLASGSNAVCEWPALGENTESLFATYTASDYEDRELDLSCSVRLYNKTTKEYKTLCSNISVTSYGVAKETRPLGRIDDLTVEYIRQCELHFYGTWYSGYGIADVYLITNDANATRRAIYQSLDLNGDSWMNTPNNPSIIADLSSYQAGDQVDLWLNGDGAGAGSNPAPDTRYTITGKITDKYLGDPIIGCNVTIEGYANHYGTVSDVEGNYKLVNIPGTLLADGSLVFDYIGYYSQTIKINRRTKIDVQLIDSGFKLLQSIKLNNVSYTSYNGGTSPVRVTAIYDDDSTADVTSSCTVTITDQSVRGVATWNSDGLYIQHGTTGTAKINVSYTENGITKTLSAPITTRLLQPQSIIFDPSTITVNVGESKTVHVYGLLENGTQTVNNLEFNYVNNDDYMDYTVGSAITVNGKPVIPLTITGKAVTAGSNIMCTCTQGGVSITNQLVVKVTNNIINVDITVEPTNITLGSHNNTLLNGRYNSVQLNAYLSDGSKIPNDLITWESNNSSQINVDSNGLVTPNLNGLLNDTATITATYDSTGYTTPIEHGVATSEVSVMRSKLYAARIQSTNEFSVQSSPGDSPTTRYEILGATLRGIQLYRFITESEIRGEYIQLPTEITSNVTNETWTSSNPDIVSVTNNGVIKNTAVLTDTEVTITYTCTSEFGGDLIDHFYILVKPFQPILKTLTFDPSSITLTMGSGTIEPFKLMYNNIDVTYEDGVEFTSSNTSIATVKYINYGDIRSLSVYGVTEGKCQITGTYNGYTASCFVTVEDQSVTPPSEDEYITAKRFDVRTKCNNALGIQITVNGSVEYYIGNDGIGPLANTNGIQCSFLLSATPFEASTGYIVATGEIPSIPANKYNDLWIRVHMGYLEATNVAYGTQITETKSYDFDLISGGGASTNTGFTEEYDCDNYSTILNGMQRYNTGWIRVSNVVSKDTYMGERFGILVSLDILP